jgi:hypothetical protein
MGCRTLPAILEYFDGCASWPCGSDVGAAVVHRRHVPRQWGEHGELLGESELGAPPQCLSRANDDLVQIDLKTVL